MRGSYLWGGVGGSAALHSGWRVLTTVLVAAFLLRLAVAWFLPSIQHADEIYQVSEQASRAVNGYGIVSWEFQKGSRVAMLPGLLKPLYRMHLPPRENRMLMAAFFAALSLIPVAVAFAWATRLYGVRAGTIAAAVMATWYELVYFAPKPTADAVSGYVFLAAIYLARPGAATKSVFLGGASLLVAFGLRLQIAPAILLAGLLVLATNPARLAFLAGSAAGLTVVGLLEWSWWGVPFKGHIGYLEAEFLHGASSFFGDEPVTYFLKNATLMYGGLLPLLGILAVRGASRAPVLFVLALALAIPFHFIGHKEYRFLLPALLLVLLLVSLAVAELAVRAGSWLTSKRLALAAGGWLIAMAAMSLSDSYRNYWTLDRNHVLAFEEIGQEPDACGIGLVGMRWWHTPGYSGIGRDVPIYEILEEADVARLLAASNYLLSSAKAPPPPAPFVRWRAYNRPAEFVYRRPGGCVAAPDAKVEYAAGIPGVD